jgi:hypothetical protein
MTPPLARLAHAIYQCSCPVPIKERQKNWEVVHYRCNYSAFNGYKWTRSNYSCVTCTKCGKIWRTKAAYVDTLPHRRDAV